MKLSVGQPHPMLPPGQPDSVRVSASIAGLDLLVALDPVSDADVRAWRRGRLRVGLVPAGRHTLFLLYEVEGFGPWSDAPFSVGLVVEERRGLVGRTAPTQRRLLRVTVVDAKTSIVRGLRMVSLSPAFSSALETLVSSHIDALSDWRSEAQAAEIEAAYRRWPASADMVRDAVITVVAGQAYT